MKNILHIYKTDWLNIFKVPIATLLIIGLMVLPSLYAWVNLIGAWDPYGNTSRVPIAVTNEDVGTVLGVRDIHKEINIGEEIVTNLKKNTKLGWTFVSREEAEQGVIHGDYYASLLIPKDFSEKVATIISDHPVKPEIQYTVNEKVNAIAPKITASGASGVVAQVNESIIKTASEAIFTVFNKVGIELEKELPTVRKIEHRILELAQHIPEIDQAANKALEIEKKIPEINEKASKIVEIEQYLPEVEAAGEKILLLEENIPRLKTVGDEIVVIQQRLPEIEKAANRIVEIDQNFYKVEKELNTALTDAKKAEEIINEAITALPKVEQITETSLKYINALHDFLTENEGAFDQIAPVIKQNLYLLQQTADAITQFTEVLKQVNFDPELAAKMLTILQGQLTAGVNVLEHTENLLTSLNNYLPNQSLTNNIDSLNKLKTNFINQKKTLAGMQTAIKNGERPISTAVEGLNGLSKQASKVLGGILARYDSEIVPKVNQALDDIRLTAQNSADVLEGARNRLPDIEKILTDSAKVASFAVDQLRGLQENLPEIGVRLHEAATTIQSKMGDLTKAVNEAANFVQNDFPKLEPKIHQAADFVRNDLKGVEDDIHRVSTFVQTRLPEIEESIHKVANLIREDLPGLEDALAKAAKEIRHFQQTGDIGEVIKLLKNDIQEESEFLAHPVLMKEKKMFPIPNYGSAMSPFYTTLALWVGALILASLLRFDVKNQEQFKSYQVYFGRLFTFMTIGIFQALIVTLGDMYLLGTYVADKLLFVLFGILISLVFMAIIYTFVSVFGNIGKALAIVFLVLQLSGSGGTFPIQVAPPFFRLINPFLPFTYAISLMREAVGGSIWDIVLRDLAFLVIFLCSAFVIGVLLKKPLSRFVEQTTLKAKKSKIIH
ncbi:YhgE/Pip-like protein [Schinkia azotoformans MEV2011]|uniref:YhgE/Pip-like protein n=1 Tax=Schinkia azotoformans MEV2011 TaxID=1348973 RepID=A0A072NP60_SCHAZ|nr:YhgE/Pip domain-containing protein [Schinkia azotoformans]KEF39037.1 YhgE/Pip-like protein [Schinkia azotoformans MEV2011]MEC1697340.1 YhgE/Pip domain-containing protein [Schinkia azotoformans]MEC1724368.1 YhgE/Pip domain-containing protein [Schinkia azotoformans]MEC1779836.1 YhgE/Pip domain-containing protein [Schinkia azotoformans]MED4331764.1 YhgE/Pip domain-containing protein [Schinkia azotoformans]